MAYLTDDVWDRVKGVVVENDEKLKIRSEKGAVRRSRGVGAERIGLDVVLAGHCRQAVTMLPRGVPGVATAIELLGVLPAAYRLGLPDVTDSGPKLFALLIANGLLAAMPSPRVVPAALALVAGVSPLLQLRSARQWTLWLGQLRVPGSAIATTLREHTLTSQISLAPGRATARPLRAAALRADRDRLAAELALASAELAQLRTRAYEGTDRAADLQVESPQLAAMSPRMSIGEQFINLLAELRQLLGVADDDARDLPQLIVATIQSLKEQTARADHAQQDLQRVLADLAAAGDDLAALDIKCKDRESELLRRHARDEAQEVELAEANAELVLRRSRVLRPSSRDVEKHRAAGAAEARRQQQARRLTPSGE